MEKHRAVNQLHKGWSSGVACSINSRAALQSEEKTRGIRSSAVTSCLCTRAHVSLTPKPIDFSVGEDPGPVSPSGLLVLQ